MQFFTEFWRSRSRFERALLVLFVLTLPLAHGRVDGDGVGYYAYLRSPLVDHNLCFAGDWKDPSRELLAVRLDSRSYPNPITKTGHLPNFYTLGPAILWLPFVGTTHLSVLLADRMGAQIRADGHSWPYMVALASATVLYGFLGLYFSFLLARKYLEERWAFWATIGIWLASSLPVYIYLEPSWSHAHSAFCVALFLWYWDRTRVSRTWRQWVVLGLISGLMTDVYLANGVFLVVPGVACVAAYAAVWREPTALWKECRLNLLFAAAFLAAFSPMIIAREIVYGSPFALGPYGKVPWNWKSPAFGGVLFSPAHGIFVCTPILVLATAGLIALWRRNARIGGTCLLMAGAFCGLISVYPWWHGFVAFGNRFLVSLTPVFVMGLAASFSWSVHLWNNERAVARRVVVLVAALTLWNAGLVYQWSTNLFPQLGPVYWNEILYNQFRRVPEQILHDISTKLASLASDSRQTAKN